MTHRPSTQLQIALFCVVLTNIHLSGQSADQAIQGYAEHGQRALTEGRYAEAQRDFEKLRTLQPGVAEVHANLGLIYFEERKFDQAITSLRQALKLKPGLVNTENLLAMSLAETGQYKEANPGLEKAFHRSSDPETKRMSGLELERAYTGLKHDSNLAVPGTGFVSARLFAQGIAQGSAPPTGLKVAKCKNRSIPQLDDITVGSGIQFDHVTSKQAK